MNITPFSPLFGDLLNTASIEDARQPQGVYVTWPTYPLPIWIPIDHCLADPVVGVTTVNLGPKVGSDHYPLEITIAGSD